MRTRKRVLGILGAFAVLLLVAPQAIRAGAEPRFSSDADAGGQIVGAFTDEVSGEPISGAPWMRVDVYDGGGNLVAEPTVSDSGTYVVPVPAGIYRLRTAVGGEPYVDEWYDGLRVSLHTIADASLVTVGSGQQTTVNFSLAHMRSIHGRITDAATGFGITQPDVQIYLKDTLGKKWTEYWTIISDGHYFADRLEPGRYKVLVSTWDTTPYLSEWYDNVTEQTDPDGVTALWVDVTNEDATDIDFSLSKGTTTTTTAPPPSTSTTAAPTTSTAVATTTTTLPITSTTTLPPTTTTTLPTMTTTTATMPSSTFTDVPSWHPYSMQINDLAAREIVAGFGAGRFGPDDWVRRQQFAKMIVLSKGYPVSEADVCPFNDVDRPTDDLYPDNYIAVAAVRRITVGIAPGEFAPWNDISRAQLITMVARAADLSEPPASYLPPFGNFSSTHYPWARKAAYTGLLAGLQGMGAGYDFWAPASRGEVCVVLYNLLRR